MEEFTFCIGQRADYVFIKGKGIRKNLIIISESTKRITSQLEKKSTNFILADYTETTTPITIADAFSLSRLYEVDSSAFRKLTIAMVIKSAEYELYRSWEDFCTQRGFNYKIFLSVSEAEYWILQQIQSEKNLPSFNGARAANNNV